MLNQTLKTLLIYTLSLSLGCLILGLSACHSENQTKIGIIVPIENKSLDEMVAGFKETLQAKSPSRLKFKVANAQGDFNLQRAILLQMKNENYDLIVPIGSVATQMTAAEIHSQPIVSLAASFSQEERAQRKNCNIAVVHDEIPIQNIIRFVHEVYPQLTKLTLIHSASDKIFPDVKAAIVAGKLYGIEIKPILVPTLNELYSAVNAIPTDSQGILILKDLLIASGISTIKIAADKRALPLIASDEGSVEEGAAFALGVSERNIGEKGATLAAAVLSGQSPCNLPIVDMKQFTVFINPKNQREDHLTSLIQAAKNLQYQVQYVSGGTS